MMIVIAIHRFLHPYTTIILHKTPQPKSFNKNSNICVPDFSAHLVHPVGPSADQRAASFSGAQRWRDKDHSRPDPSERTGQQWSVTWPQSLHILFREHREPIEARVCPLLVMWDGEKGTGGQCCTPSSTITTSQLFPRGEATSKDNRQPQPHRLSKCNRFHYWLLGVSDKNALTVNL